MAGKSDANVDKIRKKVAEFGWKDKPVHLIYDWRNFQKWYVKKMRGMTNSKTYEKAILCWKGKLACRRIANMWMLGRHFSTRRI